MKTESTPPTPTKATTGSIGPTFVEHFPRPCFAPCGGCGEHGIIVLKNGKRSEEFFSVKAGAEIAKKLLEEGLIGPEDPDRIGDHMQASKMPQTESQRRGLAHQVIILELIGSAA